MTDTNAMMTSEAELAEILAMLDGLTIPEGDVTDVSALEDVIEPTEPEVIDATAIIDGEPLAPEQLAEIESTVAEIEAQDAAEEASEPATIDLAAIEVDVEGAIRELEASEARAEAYAEQDGESGDVALEKPAASESEPAAEAITEAPAEPVKKARAPKAAKEPKAARATIATLPAEAFLLDSSVDPDDADALAKNRDVVMARRPAQVKVAEKFDNVLLSVFGGRLPSTYTVDCYRVLKAGGEATSASLTAALTSTSKKQDTSGTYSIGTARSQAGQFMALAPALRIATREGNKLVLNPDSLLAMALDTLIGA